MTRPEVLAAHPRLTVENLRAFDRSPETRAARERVRKARSEAARLRALVDAYTAPILARYAFRANLEGCDGRLIDRARDLYLVNDEEPGVPERLAAFYAECDQAARAAGFDLPPGHCPALVAEDERIRAERALLEHAETALGMDGLSRCFGDLRARALSLFLEGARPTASIQKAQEPAP